MFPLTASHQHFKGNRSKTTFKNSPLRRLSVFHSSVVHQPLPINRYFCILKTMTYFKSFLKAASHSSVTAGTLILQGNQPKSLLWLSCLYLVCHILSILPMRFPSSVPPHPRCFQPASGLCLSTPVAPNRTARNTCSRIKVSQSRGFSESSDCHQVPHNAFSCLVTSNPWSALRLFQTALPKRTVGKSPTLFCSPSNYLLN